MRDLYRNTLQIVLKCYHGYPKIYRRLGPSTRHGGLQRLLEKLTGFKLLLEERFTGLLRKYLQRSIPEEILKIILDFALSGGSDLRR